MKKSRKINVDEIKDLVETPMLSIELRADMKKFLLNYAKNRQSYNDKIFSQESSKIIRDILDELFYDYITIMEQHQKEIVDIKEDLNILKMEHEIKIKELHDLGNKFAFERITDSDDPSKWNLFVDPSGENNV